MTSLACPLLSRFIILDVMTAMTGDENAREKPNENEKDKPPDEIALNDQNKLDAQDETEKKPGPNPSRPTRGRIIVLEDSEHSRNVLKFFLEKNDFEVLAYSNGHDALVEIESLGINEAKLILTDIMMPQMTGLEFVRRLHASNTMMDVPIIVVSAMTDKENIVDARKLGVKGYLLKPISIKRVVELLKKLFPDERFIEPNPLSKRT